MPPSFRVRFATNNSHKAYSTCCQPQARSRPHGGDTSSEWLMFETTSHRIPAGAKDDGFNKGINHDYRRSGVKSRLGCRQCKLRRVKCDEAYPVCLRCQKRGSLCLPSARATNWRIDTPWLSDSSANSSISPSITFVSGGYGHCGVANSRLLQYWLERASEIMAIDPDNNPLSFPLLPYLQAAPSLVHAVQSLSAGHENFYEGQGLQVCLEERGRALREVREELRLSSTVPLASLLTIFLLGMSASWTQDRPECYGKEHLQGARAALGSLLQLPNKQNNDPLERYLMGWYVYWDMICASIADCDKDSAPIDTNVISSLRDENDNSFHPMNGFSTELYAQLGSIGTYCRQVLNDSSARDPDWESSNEASLLAWQPNHHDQYLCGLGVAFRNHGLILLLQMRNHSYMLLAKSPFDTDSPGDFQDTEELIQLYAMESLEALLAAPTSHVSVFFQSLPLLTAAAEITAEQPGLRGDSITRFKALYSKTRVPAHIWCIDLLEELWELRDSGVRMSWMELCDIKGWSLCMT